MKITIYHTDDGSITPSKQWLAHMDLGKDIYMSFFGLTEEAAKERAINWYNSERKRWSRQGNEPVEYVESKTPEAVKAATGWENWPLKQTEVTTVVYGPISDAPKPSDHALSGSVWVLNRSTGHRARIAANELASYEEKGYIRGGPRSK